jgi:hypothetical protein
LIQACKTYEPAYSPDAGVSYKDISYRLLQYQREINETLVSTVTALLESAFAPGAAIHSHRQVRLKVLTTRLASAGCLDLSVSCAVAFSSNRSLVTFQENFHSVPFEVIHDAPSTPTEVRSSSFYFLHIFDPLQGTALVPHFPVITNRALVQREIAKAMRNVAIEPPGTRVRCVAISSTDPNGAGTHRFTVFFEITKPFG